MSLLSESGARAKPLIILFLWSEEHTLCWLNVHVPKSIQRLIHNCDHLLADYPCGMVWFMAHFPFKCKINVSRLKQPCLVPYRECFQMHLRDKNFL